MTKVVLHGELGLAIGKSVWFLEVANVQEALRAIEANTEKLYSYFLNKDNGEVPYHISADHQTFNSAEQFVLGKPPKEIHITPVLAGAGGGGILAIIGAILVIIAISIITWGTGTAAVAAGTDGLGGQAATLGMFGFGGALTHAAAYIVPAILMTGVSLIFAGISQLLTPTEAAKAAAQPSYLFNGVENTTKQGVAVPVGYGELIVGSAVISVGISSEAIPINGNLNNSTGGYSSSGGK